MIHTSLDAEVERVLLSKYPAILPHTVKLTKICSYIVIHLGTVAIPIKEFWHHNMQQEPEYEHAINHK